MKNILKKTGLTVGIILLVMLTWWVISLIKCEISTAMHKDVIDAYDTSAGFFVDGYADAKVLSYSADEALVYYINEWKNERGEGALGHVITYVKADGNWATYSCDTMWSSEGNADRTPWPYWHHCFKFLIK
ncbi:MAG: hypothetical protein IJ519_01065 [Clostridia bacterium]|nr:hypothetical protein [Clostridia bacterium]